ncbi:MAG: methyltransferase domain-containing protein, partial [Methanobacteriota archaeon]
GCGMGWLAARLAALGLETFAIDIVLDEVLGLKAAGAYLESGVYFERVQGELDRPPFRGGSMDLVICNASFHYAPDPDAVVDQADRVLRPGGAFVILNSPVHEDPRSAARAERDFRKHLLGLGADPDMVAGYSHLVRKELEDRLRRRFPSVHELPFDPGLLFRWTRTIKGLVLRMELASFPILVATKAG